MAWETRSGVRYFYSAKRVGGKVVKKYVGSGIVGKFVEGIDAREHYEKDVARAEVLGLRRDGQKRLRVLDTYLQRSLTLVEAALLAAGYHRPNRGIWRKQRQKQVLKSLPTTKASDLEADATALKYVPDDPKTRALDVSRVLKGEVRGNGDFACQDYFAAACVAAYPDERRVNATDELSVLMDRLARSLSSETKAFRTWRQLLQNEADLLRQTLAGECGGSPSPLEAILIDRIIACKMALTVTERQVPATGKPEVLEFWDRAQDRVHRRFLQAVKTLAQVRRLKVPALVLLSMGQTQVNVGASKDMAP